MDDLTLLWLARLGALLCAAGAGWAISRQTVDWRSDGPNERRDE